MGASVRIKKFTADDLYRDLDDINREISQHQRDGAQAEKLLARRNTILALLQATRQ